MDEEFDVIICGQGPVGLLAANLLAQRGLRVATVEARANLNDKPRAVRIDHEAMRVLQGLGIAEEAVAMMQPTEGMDFINEHDQYICGFRNSDMAAPSGWAFSYLFHQPDLEGLLQRRLQREDVASFRGWRLSSASEDDEGITCQIVSVDDDVTTLRGRYLLGTDGARSTVQRAVIGGEIEDLGFDQAWLVVDASMKTDVDFRTVTVQVCDPNRPATYIPGPGRHRRWEFMVLPGEAHESLLRPGRISELIAPWNDADDLDFERTAVYEFHAVSPRRWSRGRAILAGDAAHQTPPFLGQGLCGGIRDVANLAWKLQAVLTGAAPEALLDSYVTERRPHFWSILQHAVRVGTIVGTLDPLTARARDTEFLAALARGENPMGSYKVPGLSGGVIGTSAFAGQIFPQYQDESTQQLNDEVTGPGWRLFGDARHVETLGVRAREACAGLGAVVVAVTSSRQDATAHSTDLAPADQNPAVACVKVRSSRLQDYLQGRWVLVRPDHYVFDSHSDPTLLLENANQSIRRSDVGGSADMRGAVKIGESS
jgi:3-(3-hydroxy-phenyl)propionate hydroxylase